MLKYKRWTRALMLAVTLCVAAGGSMLIGPSPVYAQDVEERLKQALTQAQEDYDVLQIQDAEKRLAEAIELAEQQGVQSPVVADLWVMLGIVRFAATRDEAIAVEAFVNGLRVNPKATLPEVYKTPTLSDLMERARSRVGPGEQPDDTADGGKVDGFTHSPVKTAQAGQPLDFEVTVPSDMPVYRVYLFHRRFDEENWTKTEMAPTSNTEFKVTLEPKYVRTSQLDYYIVAEDRGGNAIARSGDELNPHEAVVLGSSDVKPPGDTDPDIEVDDDTDIDPPEAPDKTIMYVNIAVGSDIGFLAGGSPTANPDNEVQPGLAPAFAHVLLDAGWTITRSAHLGLFFRFQFAPGQDFSALPATSVEPGSGFWDTEEECLGLGLPGDCILGARYKWYFSESETLRLYSSLGSGVGRIRNWLELRERASMPICEGKEVMIDANGDEFCFVRDTVRTGWLHFGLGGGLGIPLTDFMDFIVDAYLMVLVPETSVNLDVSGGMQFRF